MHQNLKFGYSWVNRFVSSRLVRKMHQNQNLDIHGSIDLSRQDRYGKCIKIKIWIFMGQSTCIVKTSTENASKSKFGYSWVNRLVSSRLVRKLHQNQNLDIHGSIDLSRQD